MCSKKIYFPFMVFLVLSIGFGFQGSQDHKVLFEKAKFTMETKGDPQGAVKLFNEILEKYPDEREYAAQSQLYIGLCYERLGLKQAQKAFQSVVDNYPDQTEAVRTARERLLLLLKAQSVIEDKTQELKIQKVLSGREASILGGISPDGRYLSATDWDTGDLVIRELATGKSRRLTNKGSWMKSQEHALFSHWSSDSKQVFYNWYNPKGDKYDIHSVGLEGQKPRILYDTKEFEYAQPFDWHPDGERVLIGVFKLEKGVVVIGYLSVVNGNFQILKTLKQKFSGHPPWGFVISPDGNTIAYDHVGGQDPNNRDIFLLSSDGAHEERLIDHPALDYVLAWTSDGQHLLYGSERTGIRGAWIIPIKGGKANGTPILVKSNIGPAYPMGCTLRNQFYFGYSGNVRDVYVVEIDPASGQILTPPKIEIRYSEGNNYYPDYSPDGKYLAYSSVRNTVPESNYSILIYSFENGEIRELDQGSYKLNYPQWRPDGKAISYEGTDGKGRAGIYLMEVDSEKVSPLVQIEENEEIYSHRWAIDGQTLFYTKGSPRTRKSWIYRLDIKTGLKEKFQGSPDDAKDIDVSPDGKTLVFLNRNKKVSMRSIPVSGGVSKELHNFEVSGRSIITPAWSSDGKNIYFYSISDPQNAVVRKISSEPQNEEWDLWMYSFEEHKARKLDVKMAHFRYLGVHPDGRHITFSSPGATIPNDEVWVMENFLPKTKDKK